jgi:DNA-directed RNA polymerase subunit RPC12/RpoP
MIEQILMVILLIAFAVTVYLAGKGNMLELIPKMLLARLEEITNVGEWEFYTDHYESVFVCSHCKENFTTRLTDDEFLKMMKHCPNCGAKMDGDKF